MFGKQKKQWNFIDVHCHLLPGIDDGARDLEETLEMLKTAYEEGVDTFLVTPHFKMGRHNADQEKIEKLIETVETHARNKQMEIKLYPGQEVFYYSELDQDLEEGKIVTMNGSDRVLIEFMPGERYTTIRNALDNVRGSGYTPILAHAERYECILKDWKRVKELKQLNCEIQVNAASITGALGYKVKRFLHKLLLEGLVDYVGTDAHDMTRRTLSVKKAVNQLYKKYDPDYVDAILYQNALALIETEE